VVVAAAHAAHPSLSSIEQQQDWPRMRQIFLDTETTGLSAEAGDRVIEIGCLEMVNRRMTGNNLHHYLNPQRSSHPDALKVHGLTDAFLSDKPLFADIAQELRAYLAGAELIIHNAAFDTGFLNAEFKRLGLEPVATVVSKVTDSLVLARETFPGKSNSLDALCKRLEVDNAHRNFHGALLDAGLLAEVYIRLTRGQGSLVHDDADEADSRDGKQQLHDGAELVKVALPILEPSAEEAAAHESMLLGLDKACGAQSLWRLQASASAAMAQ
jgi:DNA polymerase-3 subunit epsilon